jgi:hypothetical protein
VTVVTLTEPERRIVVQALHDLLAETGRYVTSTAPTSSHHDSCCEQDRARREVMAQSHAAMLERERQVRSALAKIDPPDPDDRTPSDA